MNETDGDAEELINALNSTNRDVRLHALRSAGAHNDPRCMPFLIAALHDEPTICAAAIDALGETRNREAIEPLATLLDVADVSLRTRAVRALRQIGGAPVIDALARALHNNMPQVRRAAIVALGKVRDERSLALLMSVLHDPDTRVRLSAILTLAELGDDQALPALMEICGREVRDNEAKQIQEYAAYAMRCIQEQHL